MKKSNKTPKGAKSLKSDLSTKITAAILSHEEGILTAIEKKISKGSKKLAARLIKASAKLAEQTQKTALKAEKVALKTEQAVGKVRKQAVGKVRKEKERKAIAAISKVSKQNSEEKPVRRRRPSEAVSTSAKPDTLTPNVAGLSKRAKTSSSARATVLRSTLSAQTAAATQNAEPSTTKTKLTPALPKPGYEARIENNSSSSEAPRSGRRKKTVRERATAPVTRAPRAARKEQPNSDKKSESDAVSNSASVSSPAAKAPSKVREETPNAAASKHHATQPAIKLALESSEGKEPHTAPESPSKSPANHIESK